MTLILSVDFSFIQIPSSTLLLFKMTTFVSIVFLIYNKIPPAPLIVAAVTDRGNTVTVVRGKLWADR